MVHIRTADFEAWLDSVHPGFSISEVSKKSGIPSPTLSIQRSREKVTAKTVSTIAQAYQLIPLTALASFAGFERADAVNPVDDALAVKLIPLRALMAEYLMRTGDIERSRLHLTGVADDALQRWLDAVAQGVERRVLAVQLGVISPAFSRQVHQGTLSAEAVATVADFLDVDPRVGFAAVGVADFEHLAGMSMSDYVQRVETPVVVNELRIGARRLIDLIV